MTAMRSNPGVARHETVGRHADFLASGRRREIVGACRSSGPAAGGARRSVRLLASDTSSYMTGSAIAVDGGQRVSTP
jgi:NAD(P)-dependent dehydrogenase (short-subunit alcohol dehydrogenase family)